VAGYSVSKDFNFSASHQLFGLAEGHPCSRLHGHNYIVKVVLESAELEEPGFVQDYKALDVIKRWIDETLDHQHLNKVISVMPTAENLAREIYKKFKPQFPLLKKIGISETPKTWAYYEN